LESHRQKNLLKGIPFRTKPELEDGSHTFYTFEF
ncbi:hypothetical protein ACFVGT_18685, partial [Bacillus velezensis]